MALLFWILAFLTFFYILIIAALHLGFRRILRRIETMKTDVPDRLEPFVSVVVAARNEENNIPNLLSSLAMQDYPRDKYEIIIVDDRSDDATWNLLEQGTTRIPNLRPLRISQRRADYAPKKWALDNGIRESKGEILLLTDADCTPPPTWIRSMLGFYRGDIGVVAGYSPYRYVVRTPRLIRGMLSLDCFAWAAVAAASAGWGQSLTATGTNLSYRKKTYVDIGGFESIRQWISGDDDLFMRRVAERSDDQIAYALDPATYVHTVAPRSLRQFWHQRIRFGSKGRHHNAWLTIGVVAVYLLNLMIVAGIVGTMLGMVELIGPTLIAWALKSLSEFLFIGHVAKAMHEEELMFYIIPTVVIHPFYVSLFGVLGLFGTFRWKGDEGGKKKNNNK